MQRLAEIRSSRQCIVDSGDPNSAVPAFQRNRGGYVNPAVFQCAFDNPGIVPMIVIAQDGDDRDVLDAGKNFAQGSAKRAPAAPLSLPEGWNTKSAVSTSKSGRKDLHPFDRVPGFQNERVGRANCGGCRSSQEELAEKFSTAQQFASQLKV